MTSTILASILPAAQHHTDNNHLYSPHYGSSDSTKKQQKEKAEKIQ